MTDYIIAKENGRVIPEEDRIFGINKRAKEMIKEKGPENVVNGTVGALFDENGKLVVLSSVIGAIKSLDPEEFAEYSPIGGTPQFKEAVKKAAFGSFVPEACVEAIATPGGTGAIRNAIANYTCSGDKVLTSDWYWAPYNTIAGEQGRKIETFSFFTDDGRFNADDFQRQVKALLQEQSSILAILNTPAHNPTGYSLTQDDWDKVIQVMQSTPEDKAFILLADIAYVDFAGDEEEYRIFLHKLTGLNDNVLPLIAYSASKTFTLYGMRCGALICMAKTKAVADEFRRVCEYSGRGSWSNCTRAAQAVIARIYSDKALTEKVNSERKNYREMLLKRGRIFEEAAKKAGLDMVPFDAGFFISIPCDDPDGASRKLEKEGVFIVPLAKGLRVSVASISEKDCKALPKKIKDVII